MPLRGFLVLFYVATFHGIRAVPDALIIHKSFHGDRDLYIRIQNDIEESLVVNNLCVYIYNTNTVTDIKKNNPVFSYLHIILCLIKPFFTYKFDVAFISLFG